MNLSAENGNQINVKLLLCHNRKDSRQKRFTNEGLKCLFPSSFPHEALKTTELTQKRHNNQPHSARARGRGSRSFCAQKIAGASSGQLKMTNTCAKNFHRWRYMSQSIDRLVTPRQTSQTMMHCSSSISPPYYSNSVRGAKPVPMQ